MIREFKTPEIEFVFSMTRGLKLAAHIAESTWIIVYREPIKKCTGALPIIFT